MSSNDTVRQAPLVEHRNHGSRFTLLTTSFVPPVRKCEPPGILSTSWHCPHVFSWDIGAGSRVPAETAPIRMFMKARSRKSVTDFKNDFK